MKIGETRVEDTFAEAFDMSYARLLITADDEHWLQAAVQEVTGYSSSVIACDAEVGLEEWLAADKTPDGRPGAAILLFGFSARSLAASVPTRVGQCVMTCPTTAVFDGLPDASERIQLGKQIRFFGDGYQKSKLIGERRYWRIPVMDGEFLVEESLGVEAGVGGGNLILQATERAAGCSQARCRCPGGHGRTNHTLPRRHCSQRQQGWLALSRPASVNCRRLLSHAQGSC